MNYWKVNYNYGNYRRGKYQPRFVTQTSVVSTAGGASSMQLDKNTTLLTRVNQEMVWKSAGEKLLTGLVVTASLYNSVTAVGVSELLVVVNSSDRCRSIAYWVLLLSYYLGLCCDGCRYMVSEDSIW